MTTADLGKLVPYDPAQHEGFVLDSWLKAWARPRYAPTCTQEERVSVWKGVWDTYRPVALRLLKTERIRVLVDTEDESVIWGWVATSPDESVVHDLVLKYKLTAKAEPELRHAATGAVKQMVGHLSTKRVGHTGELSTMRRLGMVPRDWYYDTVYFARRLAA